MKGSRWCYLPDGQVETEIKLRTVTAVRSKKIAILYKVVIEVSLVEDISDTLKQITSVLAFIARLAIVLIVYN